MTHPLVGLSTLGDVFWRLTEPTTPWECPAVLIKKLTLLACKKKPEAVIWSKPFIQLNWFDFSFNEAEFNAQGCNYSFGSAHEVFCLKCSPIPQ